MKITKFIIAGVAALGLTITAQAQILSNAAGAASNVADSTVGAAKGLLSLPGKSLSVGNTALPDLSAGTQEFGIQGIAGFEDDFSAILDIRYGYFFKDNWQIGFNADVVLKEGSASNGNADSVSVRLFTEYHFDTGSKWVPFIGAGIGLATIGTDEFETVNSLDIAGAVGVKYFLRENIAISAAVDFSWIPDDALDAEFGGDVLFGTRFYF